ncbi:hypothetical protein RFI_34684, partial [Reticulomyxa filosa]
QQQKKKSVYKKKDNIVGSQSVDGWKFDANSEQLFAIIYEDKIAHFLFFYEIKEKIYTRNNAYNHAKGANALQYTSELRIKLVGGMQEESKTEKYETEIKALIKLYGDVIKEDALRKKLEESNGNISVVIEQITATLLNQNVMFAFTQQQQKIQYMQDIIFLQYIDTC